MKPNFKGRDIIDINDFSKEELLFVLETAKEFDPDYLKRSKRSNYTIAQGEIAALLFFEPSTRTEQSFRSAAQKIGMGVIGFNDLTLTSMHKGETFTDTIRIMESYSNVLIIRHPEAGSAKKAADIASIPVINAGDGPNQHPTQTLLDLYTILKQFGRLDNLKVALVGDQKHYRTMHALSIALFKFSGNQIFGISPKGLEMPAEFKHANYQDLPIDMNKLNETLAKLKPDIIYAGRIPKEYMKEDTKKYSYHINKQTLAVLPKNCVIMHPLPRVDEVDPEVDSSPKAIYFTQARNGMYVREALLGLVLGRI
ncbi:aspartate carbamoyltransferase [Candidatus Daviesbacteria bacterium]|nr:aspartate carbamoyltransferase [Candidatus Daviesbacteria bacterium]